MTAARFTMDQLMHGHDYSGEECSDSLAQRKWNGHFAGWDGERLWSKPSEKFPKGNVIHAPDFFLAGLPDMPLCCELLAGREGENFTTSLRRTQHRAEWERARLMIFDAAQAEFFPDERDNVLERLKAVAADVVGAKFAEITQTQEVRDRAHLLHMLTSVLSTGGEGLMIQPAQHAYQPGRTRSLLKVKRQSLHFLKSH